AGTKSEAIEVTRSTLPETSARLAGMMDGADVADVNQQLRNVLDDIPPEFQLTDAGNGERFAYHHADAVRYCPESKKWQTWDGKRWAIDTVGHVDQLAKKTCRMMKEDASA